MSEKERAERILTLGEVKDILDRLKNQPTEIYSGPEQDTVEESVADEIEGEQVPEPAKELSFEKRAALDHVTNFFKLDWKKGEDMVKDLSAMERINEVHAYKIAELMPRDETELRTVFAKDRFTLEPEELKSILDIVDKYRI